MSSERGGGGTGETKDGGDDAGRPILSVATVAETDQLAGKARVHAYLTTFVPVFVLIAPPAPQNSS